MTITGIEAASEDAGLGRAPLTAAANTQGGTGRVTRRVGCLAIATCLLGACAGPAPPPSSSQRGVRRCDRNGDLEERLACNN